MFCFTTNAFSLFSHLCVRFLIWVYSVLVILSPMLCIEHCRHFSALVSSLTFEHLFGLPVVAFCLGLFCLLSVHFFLLGLFLAAATIFSPGEVFQTLFKTEFRDRNTQVNSPYEVVTSWYVKVDASIVVVSIVSQY